MRHKLIGLRTIKNKKKQLKIKKTVGFEKEIPEKEVLKTIENLNF